jgi:hypothetical protein
MLLLLLLLLLLLSQGHKVGLTMVLCLALTGHITFTLAMGHKNFPLALGGEMLYGLGSGTIVVAQRAVVSKVSYYCFNAH